MPISINLDGVDSWKGGAVLSPGSHPVRCVDVEEGRSSGGHFELHLTWEATGGPEQGGSIQDWVQVAPTTLGKVRQLLEACAVQVPSGEFELRAEQFRGAHCTIVVRERRKPNGDMRAEIVAYSRTSDVPSDGYVGVGSTAAKTDDDPPF